MMNPTPTDSDGLPHRRSDFSTLPEALDYAARGAAGFNFYSVRGELVATLPYRELREAAIDLARRLIKAGLPPGGRVLLLADTDPDIIIAFLACQYASLVPAPVPIPTAIGGRDVYITALRRQLASSNAVAAIAPESLLDFLREAAADRDTTVMIGTPADFHALPGDGVELRPFGPDDSCYLQYSSGSTRWPRGVNVPQRALLSNAAAVANGLDATAADRCISWLPLYHDMGLVGFMLIPLLNQRSTDYLSTRDFARRPLVWLSLVSQNGGTMAFSPTFGYDLCSRRADGKSGHGFDLSTWRTAGVGGDMIRPDVLGRFGDIFAPYGFRSTAFVPSYGMAEATLGVTCSPPDRGVTVDVVDRHRLTEDHIASPETNGSAENRRSFVVCGTPLPDHTVEIRDPSGAPLPERRIGEIFVAGPSIASGYLDDPEATAEVFNDGWLKTGDLGYFVDGGLVITGRSKDLIIINGRNIWPQDLEWAVEQLPGLRPSDVAAFSIGETTNEAMVILLVQCRLADPDARAQLVHDAKAKVFETSSNECKVVLVPPHSLPVTSSGKLSRARAKQNYQAGLYEGGENAGAAATPRPSPTGARDGDASALEGDA